MKKGVSLVSLVITIVVIIILAGITIFSSLNTIDESQVVRKEAEFEEICTFVRQISSRAEAGLLALNLSGDTIAKEAQLKKICVTGDKTEVKPEDIAFISGLGERNPKYGYHYVKGVDIENNNIKGLESISSSDADFTVPNKVENDYIINFYYGTVIANVSPEKALIRGPLK